MKNPEKNKPRWVNFFYITAAILACGTMLLAVVIQLKKGPAGVSGPVADVSINLAGGRPVREHCITCHPDGRSARADRGQAAAQHPDISPHRWSMLGCTACHLGEGMALDAEISHGVPGYGARRILKGEELQASCFTCHPVRKLKGAEKAWDGYETFLASACATCHLIAGLGTKP